MRAGSAGERESQADSCTRTRGNPGGAAAFHTWHEVRMEMKWVPLCGVYIRMHSIGGGWEMAHGRKRTIKTEC